MPQYLPFQVLETVTPDGVPVIVEGFQPQFPVTDNKAGSDSQSSASLSPKHQVPLGGPDHKKPANFYQCPVTQ